MIVKYDLVNLMPSSMIEPLLFAFCGSFFLCLAIVVTGRFHGHLTHDRGEGIQKIHTASTPRVGGVALFLGALIGGVSLPHQVQALWWLIFLAMLPAFLAGLLEDLTKRVGIKWRLLATICSGLIFSLLSGYRIDHVDLPFADWLLSQWGVSLIFTAFAIGGIANAINIIDGVHGLASGTAIIILASLGILSWSYGDMVLLGCILMGVAILLGFLPLNFPFGKLFLGDAGAYSIGYLLAIIAVALPARNPDISPVVGLIALAYPVIETMVSIWRRLRRVGSHPGQPDRLHLHSLVFRDRARKLAGRLSVPHLRNAMTSVIVWKMPLLAAAFTVFRPESSNITLLEVGAVVLAYLYLYRSVALLPVIFFPQSPRQKTPIPQRSALSKADTTSNRD